ncbi:GDSL-type esterase/lipase family protein [Vibrio parahaemolyticus]|uniref:GDSL-type esterase/lipase family protein n=1 Tax=Vibrio mediterranei TaxID=689 RepID=UPI004067C4E4
MKKIVLLGDSLTAGWGLKAGENWADKLANTFPDSEFINCGIPGDTTSGMLARFKEQVLDQKPDCFVLFGGLNDLNWGTDISVVASNINSMIAQAQHHGIRPIMVVTSAIDPVGSLPMFGHKPELVDTLRAAVTELSDVHASKLKQMYGHGPESLCVINIYQAFERYAEKEGYSSLYQNDGIHLSPLGANLIYENLLPLFR